MTALPFVVEPELGYGYFLDLFFDCLFHGAIVCQFLLCGFDHSFIKMILKPCYHPALLLQLCLKDLDSFLHALIIDEELSHVFGHLPQEQYLIILFGGYPLLDGFSVGGEHGWL